MRIKKDDTVIVLSGKDKGKKGKILRVLPEEEKVVVQNINLVKKHSRPSKKSQGGIVNQENPMSACKVMLVCPHCKEPTRWVRLTGSFKGRVRKCLKCAEIIDKE